MVDAACPITALGFKLPVPYLCEMELEGCGGSGCFMSMLAGGKPGTILALSGSKFGWGAPPMFSKGGALVNPL